MIARASKEAIAIASKKTNQALTQHLQKQASQRGWPQDVARGLSVDVNSEDPIPMSDAAQDLEYGGVTKAPMPVVREFQEKYLTSLFVSTLRSELSSRGVVI